MKRKIVQFGDTLKDLFVFTPFEEEDDWSDVVEPSLLALEFADGSFRMRGLDQSRKTAKVLTKRFVLYDKKAKEYFFKQTENKNENEYLRYFIDYLYATLRGGVKKLYAVMEDGSLRYTYAEAVSIPYVQKFSTPQTWLAFSVEFIAHDPYWYDVNDGKTFFIKNIPLSNIADFCFGLTQDKITSIENLQNNVQKINTEFRFVDNCKYNGVIVYAPELLNFNPSCVDDGCKNDECFLANNGDVFPASAAGVFCFTDECIPDGCHEIGKIKTKTCVKGSAGATYPKIGFFNGFNTPTIKNLKNGDVLKYQNVIGEHQYLIINLQSSLINEIQDLEIQHNLASFNVNDILLENGYFRLEQGMNEIEVLGAQNSNSFFTLKFFNKYHN